VYTFSPIQKRDFLRDRFIGFPPLFPGTQVPGSAALGTVFPIPQHARACLKVAFLRCHGLVLRAILAGHKKRFPVSDEHGAAV
jgi:hypothetical protein